MKEKSLKPFKHRNLSIGRKDFDFTDQISLNDQIFFHFRQLESELSALTEENNLRLTELNKTIDTLRSDRDKLQEIIYEKVIRADDTNVEVLQKSVSYIRFELEKALTTYSEQQEQIDDLTRKVEELIKKNNILSNRLREHGLDDSTKTKENVKSNLAIVKKKAQVYRGNLNVVTRQRIFHDD